MSAAPMLLIMAPMQAAQMLSFMAPMPAARIPNSVQIAYCHIILRQKTIARGKAFTSSFSRHKIVAFKTPSKSLANEKDLDLYQLIVDSVAASSPFRLIVGSLSFASMIPIRRYINSARKRTAMHTSRVAAFSISIPFPSEGEEICRSTFIALPIILGWPFICEGEETSMSKPQSFLWNDTSVCKGDGQKNEAAWLVRSILSANEGASAAEKATSTAAAAAAAALSSLTAAAATNINWMKAVSASCAIAIAMTIQIYQALTASVVHATSTRSGDNTRLNIYQ